MYKKIIASIVIGCVLLVVVPKVNKVIYNELPPKSYYKTRLLERGVLVLRKPIGKDTTAVMVDIALVPIVDKFLTEADSQGADLSNLTKLDFIGYDYLPINKGLLGFQQTMLGSKDYIVINSHAVMDKRKLEVVVYHEIMHQLREDSFHCVSDTCSLIMSPFLTDRIIDSISKDRDNQVKLLFKAIKKCD